MFFFAIQLLLHKNTNIVSKLCKSHCELLASTQFLFTSVHCSAKTLAICCSSTDLCNFNGIWPKRLLSHCLFFSALGSHTPHTHSQSYTHIHLQLLTLIHDFGCCFARGHHKCRLNACQSVCFLPSVCLRSANSQLGNGISKGAGCICVD